VHVIVNKKDTLPTQTKKITMFCGIPQSTLSGKSTKHIKWEYHKAWLEMIREEWS
jgi:hypothetical protein